MKISERILKARIIRIKNKLATQERFREMLRGRLSAKTEKLWYKLDILEAKYDKIRK